MYAFLHLLTLLPPAVVAAHLVSGRHPSRWDLVAGVGLAVPAQAWSGYAVALGTGLPVGPLAWLPLALAATLWIIVRRQTVAGALRAYVGAGRPSATGLVLLGILVVGVAVALLLYDPTGYNNGCTHRTVAVAIGHSFGVPDFAALSGLREDFPLLYFAEAAREGPVAFLASFAAAYGFLGLRFAWVATVGLAGLFGLLTARELGLRHVGWRLAAAVLFMAWPVLADTTHNDPNTVAYVVFAATLFLALRRRAPLWMFGLAFGFGLATRHVAVVMVPGWLVLAAWRREGGLLRGIGVGAFWLLAGCLPWLVHHGFAFGNPLAFESFREYGAHPHSFLGHRFSLNAMLNWPLYDQVVRTPYNALPNLLALPLWVLSRLGLVLATFGVLGAATRLTRGGWGQIAGWLAVAPFLALLSLNENWLQVAKMGAVGPVVPFVLSAIVCGAAWLLRARPRWRAVLVALLVFAGLWGGSVAALEVQVPEDLRFRAEYPWFPPELPGYLAYERERLRPGPLPAGELFRQPRPQSAWESLVEGFAEPSFERRPLSPCEHAVARLAPLVWQWFLAPEGERDEPPVRVTTSRWLELDLDRPWIDRNDWVQLGAPERGDTALDVLGEEGPERLEKFPLAWFGGAPASLDTFVLPSATWILLWYPHRFELPAPGRSQTSLFQPDTVLRSPAPPGDRVFVRVPSDRPVYVVEVLQADPTRAYRWHAEVDGDELRVRPPIPWRDD